ncbi:hypothetical protein GCM10027091_23490 [Streptomyces daliensis]
MTLASLAPSPSREGGAGTAGEAGRGGSGQSTDHVSPPALRRSPADAATTGTPAFRASRRTDSTCSGGSSNVVVWIAPTALPRSTPRTPVT